ncbi:FAD-dependent oxidoreductase [Litoribrevibacter euphylliae]|uniref:FAD-dependent oxidoreductase n=1 Tax=Litoribrevibacter euphylliae TaxID=1834034 RepID=A0ABV7HJ64_9GAMM
MNKPTLAVIGSGIAGLSAAWLLKDKYQVTLFEKHDQPGMGAYAVDVGDEHASVNIDIPLRIITSGYYRELYQLYNTVGVAIERTDHAGAFFKDSGEQVFHYKNYHFGNKSYSFLNSPNRFTRTNISHGYEATEFLWRLSRFVIADIEQLTFGDFIRRAGYQHSSFVKLVLMPMLSTICTCDYDSIYQYPAHIIVDYLTCGVTKEGVWKATYGVTDIVARLTQGYQVHTGHAIDNITESQTSSVASDHKPLNLTLDNGEQMTFDQVVIATQPQHAAQMISGIDPITSKQLASIPFEQSEMVVHRDQSIYPQHWKKLSPVYYSVDPKAQRPMATVCLNKSMPSVKDCRPVFQTWHPTVELNPKQVLARATFERPLVTFDTLKTLSNIKDSMAQPNNTLWYCGSYLGGGIPLLEAGVRSSLAVANHLGVTAPWQ